MNEFSRDGHDPRVLVGHLPMRKRPVLAVQEGSTVEPVAYFRNEEDMERFLEVFRGLLRIEEV